MVDRAIRDGGEIPGSQLAALHTTVGLPSSHTRIRSIETTGPLSGHIMAVKWPRLKMRSTVYGVIGVDRVQSIMAG